MSTGQPTGKVVAPTWWAGVLLCCLWRHDHQKAAAFKSGRLFDFTHVLQVGSDTLEQRFRYLGMGDFSAAKAHTNLDLGFVEQELARPPQYNGDVVFAGLWPKPDLFDLDFFLHLARLVLFFGAFVLELAKIHQPADWRIRLRRNLDQIRVEFLRHRQRLRTRHYAQLLAINPDDPQLRRSDALIYSMSLGANCNPLLRVNMLKAIK